MSRQRYFALVGTPTVLEVRRGLPTLPVNPLTAEPFQL